MKVLYLIDTLAVGGAEQSLLEIISRFEDTQPLMCHLYPGESLKGAYEGAGIPVVSMNLAGKYAFPEAIQKVCTVIRREVPDVIHTTLFRADIVGRIAGLLTGVPVISSFINESYHPSRWSSLSYQGRLKLWGVFLLDKFTARWVRSFMAVSAATRQANCQALKISSAKVTVIYRGRNPKPFLTVPDKAQQQLRNELGLGAESPIILNVARIIQRKGQEELIRAFPTVLKTFPQAKLVIAGDGHARPMLESLIAELRLTEAVYLLGVRRDVPELLTMANVFAFPSHYEGHPGAVVEAMLATCPVVASDIPVHREILIDGSGLLTPVQDVYTLANSLLEILQQPILAKQMAHKARSIAMDRFDITQVAYQHEALYQRVLENTNL